MSDKAAAILIMGILIAYPAILTIVICIEVSKVLVQVEEIARWARRN